MDAEFYEIKYEDLSNEELVDEFASWSKSWRGYKDGKARVDALRKVILNRMEDDNNGSK